MSNESFMAQQEMRAYWVRFFCAALRHAHVEAKESQRPVELAIEAADEALEALLEREGFEWLLKR